MTSDKICKIKADTLVPIDLIFESWPAIQSCTIELPDSFDGSLLEIIKTQLPAGTIPLRISFTDNAKKLVLDTTSKITVNAEIISSLSKDYIVISIVL